MATFDQRLTRLEKTVERIEQHLWEQDNEPLIPDDGCEDFVIDSPIIQDLKEQLARLEIERQNLLDDGANIIKFPEKT